MTKQQEEHLKSIKDEFVSLVDSKYRAGQKEHGGDLWEMGISGLVDCMLEEAIDQVVYCLTLKDQIEHFEER